MAGTQPVPGTLKGLETLVQTSISLIKQFEEVLNQAARGQLTTTPPSPTSDTPPQSQSIDALSLAHDSASLIRAHSTKLSLLIINKPFTPSAVVKVLQELVAGPIPGLASAVQLCAADRYTSTVREDLAWRCHRVLKELRGLIEVIPLDGNILSPEKRDGVKGDKGSLTVTGVIWAACDDVIQLQKFGVANLLIKKVQQYRDTLQDVLDELKEWKEEGEQRGDDDDEDGEEPEDEVEYVTNQLDTTHLSAQDMVDDLMNTRHIPRNDSDKIGERLEACLKRLRLTTLLYAAIVKRRLKVLPLLPASESSPVPRRLDEVLAILKRLTDRFNEVACAFYDLEPDAIDQSMDACFFDAFAASEMLVKPWDGERDEFTDWVQKFQVSIKKPE
ncbi:hypothetical protein PFICI_15211 [Pestalotiopsis fici W106-1]|uniref:Cyclin-D1-binding protein 1-like N-terminal domain-containing protein n=1 Tax=Pestalotiopsis fici (strain W106-1 / CGMCC3.15140) TaxID=1229662 RepID=W3WJQ2_PESFW|nr:uncharacterized protein PFICI_15211 [Pestalotiopsis fici W106-1]ETS73036.1 hypothetical protein PFICI_15211 [Pestalotiopsis fici W106-1]